MFAEIIEWVKSLGVIGVILLWGCIVTFIMALAASRGPHDLAGLID
jgi:hypothetical protein